TFTKINSPTASPSGSGNSCAFSLDNKYLAVAHSISPRIALYSREGDSFTRLLSPAMLPPNNGYACAFSPDGTHLAVGHEEAPYVTIYKAGIGAAVTQVPIIPAPDSKTRALIYTGEGS